MSTERRKSALKDGERVPKKSGGLLCQRNEVKYSLIAQHKNIAMVLVREWLVSWVRMSLVKMGFLLEVVAQVILVA